MGLQFVNIKACRVRLPLFGRDTAQPIPAELVTLLAGEIRTCLELTACVHWPAWWRWGLPLRPSPIRWSQFYADSQQFEAAYAVDPKTAKLKYQNAILADSTIPAVSNHLAKNFPQFDLGIPDQWRVDLWVQDLDNDIAAGTVPALSILWIMDDHTGGPPTAQAQQADNDLAVGRIIDYISHSNVWASSAIFLEEDDSQNGVDHIDGHRSPGYVVSPYAVQSGPTDSTYYTQVNMTRARSSRSSACRR